MPPPVFPVVTTASEAAPYTPTFDDDDRQYDAFLERTRACFEARSEGGKRPLFTTSAEGLFDAYLDALPAEHRQHHTCRTCRRFVEAYGGLVVLGDDGRMTSAMWDFAIAPGYYLRGVDAMLKALRKAKVTGIFLSGETTWGTVANPKGAKHGGAGVWHHFAVIPSSAVVYRDRLKTPFQAMAEKREEHHMVARALDEYPAPLVKQAVAILKADALYRGEKVLGPAEFLDKLHDARAAALDSRTRDNLLWLAVSMAPAGFCHPRSSMVGTLLDDLAAKLPIEDVKRKFADKMKPTLYQRPQAAPTAGNISLAEAIVEKLGIKSSLARRYARVEEIQAVWRLPAQTPEKAPAGGVFGHLKPKGARGAAVAPITIPGGPITWMRFMRDALVHAHAIDVLAPIRGNYVAIATAVDPSAPPILQWDHEGRRNPFSWYVVAGGSDAAQWRLTSGWRKATAITAKPSMWHGPELYAHHGRALIFVLDGARPVTPAHAALFPEILRSELHSIRSTIEAFSGRASMEDLDNASACGLMFHDGSPVQVRVTGPDGNRTDYTIDRFE